ncbi:MAG: hypothetical protein ACYS1A_08215 [Planctomycetota bacterium]
MGRKTKLTPKLQDKICDIIRRGNYIEVACGFVGIDVSTYYNWLKWGEAAKSGKYFEFFKAAKRAENEQETLYVENIRKAAFDGVWQASAWYLERKYPERWGRKERKEITGKDGGPIEVKSYAIISPEDWPDDDEADN